MYLPAKPMYLPHWLTDMYLPDYPMYIIDKSIKLPFWPLNLQD